MGVFFYLRELKRFVTNLETKEFLRSTAESADISGKISSAQSEK